MANMPFVQTQFNEAMDKTVTEAKAEVEAFVSHKVTSLGLASLKELGMKDAQLRLEGKDEK